MRICLLAALLGVQFLPVANAAPDEDRDRYERWEALPPTQLGAIHVSRHFMQVGPARGRRFSLRLEPVGAIDGFAVGDQQFRASLYRVLPPSDQGVAQRDALCPNQASGVRFIAIWGWVEHEAGEPRPSHLRGMAGFSGDTPPVSTSDPALCSIHPRFLLFGHADPDAALHRPP